MITRRQTALAAPLLLFPSIARGARWFSRYPFSLGVASGDPAPDGFVIWTRLAPEPFAPHGGMPLSALPVSWEVGEDAAFRTIASRGEAIARPELGHSVHVEVTGLQPDRGYWYRFKLDADESLTGKARTLPPAGASLARLRFGVCGCQHYESGLYTAFRHLAQEEELAFVFHYGDFIYERGADVVFDSNGLPTPKVRNHNLREVYSLDDYRAHYAQYLLDLDLQSARMRHAFLSSFDDHEVQNNFTGNISEDESIPPEVFLLRRQAAMQAWYEHMPVRRAQLPAGPSIQANRRFDFGNLATINVLDTRSFRTNQPCGDGLKPACPDVFGSDVQVLGAEQEAWLDRQLATSDATWNCLAQQILAMAIDFGDTGGGDRRYMDSWAGYEEPRKRLMRRLREAGNAVMLTGDVHQNAAGLLYDEDRPAGVECVVTSISSTGSDWSQLRGLNPHVKFVNSQRGYAVCDVSPDAWQTHYMVVDDVTKPGGNLSRAATVSVPRDRVEIALG
ncbi:MAG TPA: alkaline phosphatase D family protein [Sphingomonadaceae bacterium]|nr:alkaline phosphatase D family protein [Sphingomonadaceae bacterium]